MVPLARLERALLAELDFESSASTNSTTGALAASIDDQRNRGSVSEPLMRWQRLFPMRLASTGKSEKRATTARLE